MANPNGNPQNLIAPPKKGQQVKGATKETLSKGGKRAAETNRNRKAIMETVQKWLDSHVSADITNKIAAMGVDKKDIKTFNDALVVGQLFAAIKGNPTAASWVRDSAGEKPVDKQEISGNTNFEVQFIGQAGNPVTGID